MNSDAITYAFFNMDSHKFCGSLSELYTQVGKSGTIRAIMNYPGGILYAAGQEYFEEWFVWFTINRTDDRPIFKEYNETTPEDHT